MRELALFAGGGGGILGSYLLGWKTVCAVEIEDYPRRVLLERQRDGILPRFPIWDDITTFDGQPWKGRVDIISGGFPCQDISLAGKGKGITGSRSGLWKEMVRVVYEVQPKFVFVENVPALLNRGMGVVLRDLAQMGYDARWCVLGAYDAGAPHRRKRIWILAYSDKQRGKTRISESIKREKGKPTKLDDKSYIEWWNIDPADLPDTNQLNDDMGGPGASEILQSDKTEVSGCKISNSTKKGLQDRPEKTITEKEYTEELERLLRNQKNWPIESRVGRVVNGIPCRVDRLKALGNGQVPSVAALAFIILSEGLL